MLDVHLPATDGRELRMSRHTQALPEHQMILDKLKLKLPEQPHGIFIWGHKSLRISFRSQISNF